MDMYGVSQCFVSLAVVCLDSSRESLGHASRGFPYDPQEVASVPLDRFGVTRQRVLNTAGRGYTAICSHSSSRL